MSEQFDKLEQQINEILPVSGEVNTPEEAHEVMERVGNLLKPLLDNIVIIAAPNKNEIGLCYATRGNWTACYGAVVRTEAWLHQSDMETSDD